MHEFLPYITNDYSVGLYSNEVDDIYHSAFGALTEAYEKFIKPVDLDAIFKNQKDIKVLDICYGIGYNTKVFLNEFVKKKPQGYNINIDCVDSDELLIKISPFISSRVNLYKRLFYKKYMYKNIENYNQAKKIVRNYKKSKSQYRINPCVGMILIKNLVEKFGRDFLEEECKKNHLERVKKVFFDNSGVRFYKFWTKKEVLLDQNKNNLACLHNIYYGNISTQYILCKSITTNNNLKINFYPNDIRNFLKNTNSEYDVVFLDGFTPSKCPCIWSIDFFKQIYNHLNDTGVLVTYNSSAAVRNAMLKNKFYIGNNLNDSGKIIGTIASKTPDKIKFKLSEKNIGLLNTKAGIPYRDENLILDNDTILNIRRNEDSISSLEPSSKYLKRFKNEI